MKFAVDHAADFENMLNSPGWAALQKKAIEDIQGKYQEVFDGGAENLDFARGYVAGIKVLLEFPHGMILAAQNADEFQKKKVQTRRQVIEMVK